MSLLTALFGGDKKPAEESGGCGTCDLPKGATSCGSHLIGAAKAIAQAFIENKRIFNRNDGEDLGLVRDMLANDMRNDKNKPVAYAMPEGEAQEMLFSAIELAIAVPTVAAAFQQSKTVFDRANGAHLAQARQILATQMSDEVHGQLAYTLPEGDTTARLSVRTMFFDMIRDHKLSM
ncbi:MAG: hypothetical protein EB059_09250 [Alphaproteobacteria bacterium]|nr:hypothetical protein [Alphaproteobacteria bacterium]